MSLQTSLVILRKDLVVGRRVGLAIWVLAIPIVLTLAIRLVFGGLLDPHPRLLIFDAGESKLVAAAQQAEGLEVVLASSEADIRRALEDGSFDAGLSLPPGFDAALLEGSNPTLPLMISGASLASSRAIVAITIVDLVRSVVGEPAPVDVVFETPGRQVSAPLVDRLIPLMVLLAVSFAGGFLPAASILQERTSGTIVAVVSTSASVGELLLAKGIAGFVLSFALGAITLLLNGVLGGAGLAYLAVLAIAAWMCVLFGLVLGTTVSGMDTMFAVWKSAGVVLFAPALLLLFPGVPAWIGRLFPTYYFINPLYQLAIDGEPFAAVATDLAIGAGICAAVTVVVRMLGIRMDARLQTA